MVLWNVWGTITVAGKPQFYECACTSFAHKICARACATEFAHTHLHILRTHMQEIRKCDGLRVSIHHAKRTLGRRNFTRRVTGGASMLRRFHLKWYQTKIKAFPSGSALAPKDKETYINVKHIVMTSITMTLL